MNNMKIVFFLSLSIAWSIAQAASGNGSSSSGSSSSADNFTKRRWVAGECVGKTISVIPAPDRFNISAPTTSGFSFRSALQSQEFWKGMFEPIGLGYPLVLGNLFVLIKKENFKLPLEKFAHTIGNVCIMAAAFAKMHDTYTKYKAEKRINDGRQMTYIEAIDALNLNDIAANKFLLHLLVNSLLTAQNHTGLITGSIDRTSGHVLTLGISQQFAAIDQDSKLEIYKSISSFLEELKDLRDNEQKLIDLLHLSYDEEITREFIALVELFNFGSINEEESRYLENCFVNGQPDLNLYKSKRLKENQDEIITEIGTVRAKICIVQNEALNIIQERCPQEFKATVNAVSNELTNPLNNNSEQYNRQGIMWECGLTALAAVAFTVWTWREHIPWRWFKK